MCFFRVESYHLVRNSKNTFLSVQYLFNYEENEVDHKYKYNSCTVSHCDLLSKNC